MMSSLTDLSDPHPARWRPSTGQAAGIILLAVIALFALSGPWLVDIDPAQQQLERFLEAPSLAHPLGFDQLGRSMLSRLALSLALVSVLSAATPGVLIGLLAAWRGGWFERMLTALAAAGSKRQTGRTDHCDGRRYRQVLRPPDAVHRHQRTDRRR